MRHKFVKQERYLNIMQRNKIFSMFDNAIYPDNCYTYSGNITVRESHLILEEYII